MMPLAPDRVLVVAAHPDDEVLGCGATIARLTSSGTRVDIAYVAAGVGSRVGGALAQDVARRRAAAREACQILGAEIAHVGDFPDNRLDTVPLLDVVQTIEEVLAHVQPAWVLTHHSGDLNLDHRRVHEAVMTACRPQPASRPKCVLAFEIPSSTEWQSPGAFQPFVPTLFVDVSEQLEAKRRALEAYSFELRPWPHSRSYEAVESLARWRGASVGVEAAEAFILIRGLVSR